MRISLLLLSLLLSLSAPVGAQLRVVTSFSILADITRNIGGGDIELHNLVGANEDARRYAPSLADARYLREADVVIENGLGFEPWMDRLAKSSGSAARRARVSDGAALRGTQGGPDPHAWLDLNNAELYVRNITRALMEADPGHAAHYQHNHDLYLKKVRALLAQARRRVGALPARNRVIGASREAVGYLGQSCGLAVVVPPGLSGARPPSAEALATSSRQFRDRHVQALFLDGGADPRVLRQLADGSGARLGGPLYVEALSSRAPADSYLGVYRSDVDTLVRALGR